MGPHIILNSLNSARQSRKNRSERGEIVKGKTRQARHRKPIFVGNVMRRYRFGLIIGALRILWMSIRGWMIVGVDDDEL